MPIFQQLSLQATIKSISYEDAEGIEKPLDAPFLHEEGMTRYSDSLLITPEQQSLLRHWHALTHLHESDTMAQKIILKRLKKSRWPRLLIKREPALHSYGLYANEDIPEPLTPIGLYSGVVRELESHHTFQQLVQGQVQGIDREKGAYLMRLGHAPLCADARLVGSAMRFINDDFPNVATFYLPEVAEPIICTLEPIKKGSPLALNYGVGQPYLKWGTAYRVISEERMLSYFQMHPIENILSSLFTDLEYFSKRQKSPTFANKYADYLNRMKKIFYTLITPAALAKAVLRGATTAKQWLALFTHEGIKRSILDVPHNPHYYSWIVSLLYYLDKVQEAPSPLKRLLADNFDTYTVFDALRYLQIYADGDKSPFFLSHPSHELKSFSAKYLYF